MPITYSNPRRYVEIPDWPIGATRTAAIFKIEYSPARGERATRTTMNPRTGKPNATKTLTYAHKVRIVDGDDGRTYLAHYSSQFNFVSIMRGDMKYQEETIFPDNPRFPEVMALFETTPAAA